MRLSLPLRLFLYYLAFIVALGGATALMIRHSFQRYAKEWESELRTLPAEELFRPLASEVARSLLLEVESSVPEKGSRYRSGIGEGLDAVLPTLPSVESLIIMNREGDALYVSPSTASGLKLGPEADEGLPALDALQRVQHREVVLPSGERRTEVRLPVYDRPLEDGGRRLGAAIVRFRSDPDLARRLAWAAVAGSDEPGPIPAPERLLTPLLEEVARSMLLEADAGEQGTRERLESYRVRVSDGLNKVLPSVGAIESLVIVDRDRRIQYVNARQYLDLKFTGDDEAERFNSSTILREPIRLASGAPGTEIILPVYDKEGGPGEQRGRLGSVLVRYRHDPELAKRIPELRPPNVPPSAYTQPLILFLTAAFGGGILLAALGSLPVRRLERALSEFRARGFRGGLDPGAGLARDLGPAVRAINEMGGKLQALDARGREREALLATLSQSLEEGMIALDPAGAPVAWNPAATRLLLTTAGGEAAAGTAPKPHAGALREALARNHDLVFALEGQEGAVTREAELVRGDGGRVPARVTQVPFEIRPGEIGTLLLIRDLATLREVETHLLEAGRFAVLAHLAAGLAHEIRNPLHSIRINATAAEQYVEPSAGERSVRAVTESLATIKSETERLADLLNNYLGMVRPEKEATVVDVRELCRRVVQLVGYSARKSRIEIRLEGQESIPLVHGIPDRLQQAILNLVLNAIQAMPDGGTLRLHTESSGGIVRVSIADTGPGLAQELADQLFDTRVTTKPGGSGLGLPLVRMIVEAHGGSVWYRSAPEHGATFTLVLPAADGR